MRSRRHQERLEKYYKVVNDTILKHQVGKTFVNISVKEIHQPHSDGSIAGFAHRPHRLVRVFHRRLDS